MDNLKLHLPYISQYLPYISQVHNLTADTQKLRARVADKEAAVQKGHVELASTRPRASPLALACISSVSPLHLP